MGAGPFTSPERERGVARHPSFPRLRSGLGILLLLSGIASAAPQGPNSPATKVQPEQLIAQLADKNLRIRELAHHALESLGEKALPALRKAQTHSDPEVRRRVAMLLAARDFATMLAPKRVTLHVRDKTVKEAVAELAKQSGYKVEIGNSAVPAVAGLPGTPDPEKQHIRLDVENATFWEALDQLCRAGGLVYNDNIDDTGRVLLHVEDSYQPFVSRQGLFRAVAQGFQQNRSINFATMPKGALPAGQANDNLHFNFCISAEPRLPLLGLGTVVLTEAVDDLGNSLIPGEGSRQRFARHYWYGYYKSHVQRTGCALVPVAREARRVKRLKGIVPVTLLLEEKPDIVVQDVLLAKGKKFKSDRAELDLDEVTEMKNQGSYRVKLAVRNKAVGVEYGWYNSITQRLVMLDAKGNKYHQQSGSWGGNQNSVTGDFRFGASANDAGPPVKLIYYDWITTQYRMKFEFRDLPLP